MNLFRASVRSPLSDNSFSTEVFTAAGEARSQLITQLYKRARPAIAQQPRFASLSEFEAFTASPIFFFPENEVLDHLQFFDSLSPPEKASLTAKMIRRHFQTGDQLVAQGEKNEAFHFVFAGVIQVANQWPDGRGHRSRS